jgi:dephospho-CoA kinase
MKLFGLTGGIGMGKSTSARFLSGRGIPIIDTDALAHQLVEPGHPALEEIKETFGADIVSVDGRLRRDELARRVFSDAVALRKLENILHPRIREIWKTESESWRKQGLAHGVIVIPLLFETAAESDFDAILCVACSSATQRQRLRERGWSDEQIEQRITAQWPIEKKIAQSDFIIWTDTTLEAHAAQLDRIFAGN